MPTNLKPSYAKQDEIPEAARGAYVQEGESWNFRNPIDIELLPDVAGLKSTMNKNKREYDELSERVKAYDGVDPLQYKKDVEELKDLRLKLAGNNDERDRSIQTMKEGHKVEIDKLTGEKTELSTKLKNKEKTSSINEALADTPPKSKGALKALSRLLMDQLDVEIIDGNEVTVVKNAKGETRYSKATGERMTAKELVEEMAGDDEYADMFAGAGVDGGDVKANASTGSVAMRGGKINVTKSWASVHANYQQMKTKAKEAGRTVDDMFNVTEG